MLDPRVQDITVKPYRTVVWYADGRKEYVQDVLFTNDLELHRLVERLVGPQGRELGASTPMLDAWLPRYGARLNAVLPPISLGGIVVTISKYAERFRHWDELLKRDMLTPETATLLDTAVQAQDQHPVQRRHRQRQDHAAQRGGVQYPRPARARGHHRNNAGALSLFRAARLRRASGALCERRRQRRSNTTKPHHECLTDVSNAHHHWRDTRA